MLKGYMQNRYSAHKRHLKTDMIPWAPETSKSTGKIHRIWVKVFPRLIL